MPFDLSLAQYNSQGQIALCHYQTTNPLVETSSGVGYKFMTQHNICLSWINPEHVQEVLAKTKRCCGNNTKHVFRLATETDVRRWTNGGR